MLIFAIDDEPLALERALRTIREAEPGAEVRGFSLAAPALEVIEKDGLRPDVVFSDIRMPGITGLEFAIRLKNLSPDTRVVFVTGYSEYAVESYKVRAHGYVLKPLTPEQIREELDALPTPPAPAKDKLQVQCCGVFEVYWQGQPLLFRRTKTKELLAFLIDRSGAICTPEEIALALWETEASGKAEQNRIRVLLNDLLSTLRSIGMEDIIVRKRRQLAIRTDRVDCDYYRMRAGDIDALNTYYGVYMEQYSWAEMTGGELYFKNYDFF